MMAAKKYMPSIQGELFKSSSLKMIMAMVILLKAAMVMLWCGGTVMLGIWFNYIYKTAILWNRFTLHQGRGIWILGQCAFLPSLSLSQSILLWFLGIFTIFWLQILAVLYFYDKYLLYYVLMSNTSCIIIFWWNSSSRIFLRQILTVLGKRQNTT